MELMQLEQPELFTYAVTSQTLYLNVLFPSKYRYYFELVSNSEIPILIDHPFRLYYPQTVSVTSDGSGGIYLILNAEPAFNPFGPLTVQIYIPQVIYEAMVVAMLNPINSPGDLVPPPAGNAFGEIEFVLLSTDVGEQIKIDLVNQPPFVPEVPVTVKTLQWNEIMYYVMSLDQPLSPSPPSPPSLPSPPSPPSSVVSSYAATLNAGAFNTHVFNGLIVSSEVIAHSLLESHFAFLSPSPLDSSNMGFAYTTSGMLGITFIDPRYCFLREWITLPDEWTQAIKDFAGV